MITLLAFDIGNEVKVGGGRSIRNIFPDLGSFISAILPNIYIFTGIILFIILIVGGFLIIVNAGSGNEDAVKNGQKALTASIVGLLIVFASWWIIKIIEIITGVTIF